MPYTNLPADQWEKMESCVAQVQATGKSKPVAIAICYNSITHKKVLLSPTPLPTQRTVGDLIAPGGNTALTWTEIDQRAAQGDEWAQQQQRARVKAWQLTCSAPGCPNVPVYLLRVGSEELPYCETCLPGVKALLTKHRLKITHERSARLVLIAADKDAKGLQFITRDGQVVPLGGPASGGGSDVGQQAVVDVLRSHIQQQTHSLQDVVDGKYSVGVEGRGGRDIEQARSLGMYTTTVNNTPIFARTEEDARPLIDYLSSGGRYGTARFSELLGYTPEQIAEYEQFLDLSQQGNRKENRDEAQAEPALPPPTELDDIKATAPDLAALAATIADRASGKATAEDIQRDLLVPWQQTVFGSPASDQMQKVAARTFGFPDPSGTEELKINWDLLYPLGELYNITQEYLTQRGFISTQTIPVYRPHMPTEARPKQWQPGDTVRIKLLPLTSWTLDKREAVEVAQALGAPGSPVLVLKTFIPIRSVVGIPQTGLGVPGTSEVVLAGGEYEALVELRYE